MGGGNVRATGSAVSFLRPKQYQKKIIENFRLQYFMEKELAILMNQYRLM